MNLKMLYAHVVSSRQLHMAAHRSDYKLQIIQKGSCGSCTVNYQHRCKPPDAIPSVSALFVVKHNSNPHATHQDLYII